MYLDELNQLNELRLKGALSQEEYEVQKSRLLKDHCQQDPILSSKKSQLGLSSNNYCALMNAALLLPGIGILLSLVFWLVGKEGDEMIRRQGGYIFNFVLSAILYSIFALPLLLVGVGIFVYIFLGIAFFLFPIIGAIKSLCGEVWRYPASIPFIRE